MGALVSLSAAALCCWPTKQRAAGDERAGSLLSGALRRQEVAENCLPPTPSPQLALLPVDFARAKANRVARKTEAKKSIDYLDYHFGRRSWSRFAAELEATELTELN